MTLALPRSASCVVLQASAGANRGIRRFANFTLATIGDLDDLPLIMGGARMTFDQSSITNTNTAAYAGSSGTYTGTSSGTYTGTSTTTGSWADSTFGYLDDQRQCASRHGPQSPAVGPNESPASYS